ncbi:NIPSNAP family protein [Paraburkholderia susongensis]|uniref:NIPSNAP protein n=1 Tax=Paraburkholderia susongensis TaxID=1515439 RepID=A0A1X7LHI5_9BURK|nr:NIPSNAP family protein [Paraburkholderia susongensis]SMG53007.1 NIPSNAP protein [Paraburkholderia susongensis]
MIYELRTYTLCPGGLGPWLKLYEEKALPIFAAIEDMRLVGYFRTETGCLNRVVHLWCYPSLQARESVLRALAAHPDWDAKFVQPARPYLMSQETTFLSPVAFSPLP